MLAKPDNKTVVDNENTSTCPPSTYEVLKHISASALELRDLTDSHNLDILRYLLSTVSYEADTLLMSEKKD